MHIIWLYKILLHEHDMPCRSLHYYTLLDLRCVSAADWYLRNTKCSNLTYISDLGRWWKVEQQFFTLLLTDWNGIEMLLLLCMLGKNPSGRYMWSWKKNLGKICISKSGEGWDSWTKYKYKNAIKRNTNITNIKK